MQAFCQDSVQKGGAERPLLQMQLLKRAPYSPHQLISFLRTQTPATYTQWKRHMQMPLISAIRISHHYAALCKTQLIPAYYPSAKSFCLISSSLAAAGEEQPCPSEEPIWHITPAATKNSSRRGLINFNQVGAMRPKKHGDFSFSSVSVCLQKAGEEKMKRRAEIRTSVRGLLYFGVCVWGRRNGRGGRRSQIRAERALMPRRALSSCSLHPCINLHGHVSPDPWSHLASRAQ